MDGAGSHHGLVFPLCRQLGLREELKDPFVLVAVQEAMEKARPEIAPRPGKSVHQPGFHQVPRGRDVRIGGSKGRATGNIFTAPSPKPEIRGGLPQRISEPQRSQAGYLPVSYVLQPPPTSSVFKVQNTGRSVLWKGLGHMMPSYPVGHIFPRSRF